MLTEAQLGELAAGAFAGLGLDSRDARDAARILVLGELLGIGTHGVGRIPNYAERIGMGGIRARPDIRIERVAPAIARLDGGNGLGPLVGTRALEAAMELARECGTGVVFARASNHFGPVAPYSLIAAEAGFASIIGSNSTTTIAPWGGREARLGNSPVGFGVPNPEGAPVILDMALSVVARARIRAALKRGESIPPTWATDKDGNATTDAQAALDGFLQPIGGHKGYGLALVVDLFAGLLSGAAYLTHVKSWSEHPELAQDLGHFFFLIDASRLGPAQWLAARLRDFVSILHTTPPARAESPVLVPGEIELGNLERHRRQGIRLDADLRAELEALAARAIRA